MRRSTSDAGAGVRVRDAARGGQFIAWTLGQMDAIRATGESTTRHGKLKDMRVTLEGNHVCLIFEYTTGDAAGQNMVKIPLDRRHNSKVDYSALPALPDRLVPAPLPNGRR